MRRLTGWQRLWVFLGVIYIFPVAYVTYTGMPKKDNIMREWAIDVIKLVKRHDDTFKNLTADEILERYKDLSYDSFIVKTRNKATGKTDTHYKAIIPEKDFQNIEEWHQVKLEKLFLEQIKFIFKGFLLWIIPLISIYLFVCGTKWVYQGFKNEKAG